MQDVRPSSGITGRLMRPRDGFAAAAPTRLGPLASFAVTFLLSAVLAGIILFGSFEGLGRVTALLVALGGLVPVLWYLTRTERLTVQLVDRFAWSLMIFHTILVYRSRSIQELVNDPTPTLAIAVEIGIWMMLLIYALGRLTREPRRLGFLLGPGMRYASLLALLAFLSTAYALSASVTFAWSMKLMTIVLLACAMIDPENPLGSARRLLDATYHGLLAMLGFFVLFALASPWDGFTVSPRTGILRLGGTILPAVALSTVAGLAAVLALIRAILAPAPGTIVMLAITSSILALSLGRGGMLGTATASIVALALMKRLRLFPAALGGLLLLFLAFPSVLEFSYEMLTRRQSLAEIRSFTGRDLIWSEALEMIFERPWLGWGYVSGSRIGLTMSDMKPSAHAHNVILEIMVSLGVLGAMVLSALYLRTLAQLIRLARRPGKAASPDARGLHVELLSILTFLSVIGLFTPSFADAPRYETCVFIAVALVADRLSRAGSREI